MDRISWDEYFMEFAKLARLRSTCLRRPVGAILVKDRHILATGYNGVPRGMAHCETTGCLRQQKNIPSGSNHELCRGLHAEQNVIIQAARHGIIIEGADIYSTTKPCVICCKMIINSGIRRVYFDEDYTDPLAKQFFEESGVETIRVSTGLGKKKK